MTRDRGPRQYGVCPVCGRVCALLKAGGMRTHRALYRRHYRGSYCRGVGQPPIRLVDPPPTARPPAGYDASA
jgi:hypothetical protein